jgi:hemerythrin superfamily protein
MGTQSNQEDDHPGRQPQPDSPAQPNEQAQKDKLGNNPDEEGDDNESLPEGSADTTERERSPLQGEVLDRTERRRGDSQSPSLGRRKGDNA